MEFVCHVGTAEGRVLRQVRSAPTEEALRSELEREGLALVGLERGKATAITSARKLSLGRRRVPLPLLLVFAQELAALLRAGLPLLQSLQMLATRQRDPRFKGHLEQVLERVRSGTELSAAFGELGDALPPLFASSLKAGERTGELEQVLTRFTRYLKLLLDARRKVYTALVYPTLLVGLSVGMLAIMAIYVVPKFELFYASMDADLPALTRLTMGTGKFLKSNLLFIVAAGFVAAFAVDRWSRTGPGRLALARFRLSLPVLGGVFERFALSEYCRSLSTLVAGGLPLVQSLEISTSSIGNAWIQQKLAPVVPRVREGRSLHQSLAETGVVPQLAVDMVEVGEATGALDTMLANISTFLDEEIETRMARLLSVIEPVLLLVVGGLVAVLLISVYLPIFSALTKIS